MTYLYILNVLVLILKNSILILNLKSFCSNVRKYSNCLKIFIFFTSGRKQNKLQPTVEQWKWKRLWSMFGFSNLSGTWTGKWNMKFNWRSNQQHVFYIGIWVSFLKCAFLITIGIQCIMIVWLWLSKLYLVYSA